LDRHRGVPLRTQLEGELRQAIRSGRLTVGERLPSSRVLAHWCTLFLSVVVDRPLMHPRCRQVIALLA
jgi:GntR family transcriptional regulator / MocR family aminotransferase